MNNQSRTLTPNQIVALNLALARRLRGMTQEQAAERLEPHLGKRLSKASYSATERSWESGRVRHFTADELYAFARTFELPITFFLIPPREADAVGIGADPIQPGEFLDMLFQLDEDTRKALMSATLDRLPWEDARGVLRRYLESWLAVFVGAKADRLEEALQRALTDETRTGEESK